MKFKAGDNVKMAGAFLRNTGQIATSYRLADWRGTVEAVRPLGSSNQLITVRWTVKWAIDDDDTDDIQRVLASNLSRCKT